MPPTRGPRHALGVTASKSRAAATRTHGKRAATLDTAAKAVEAAHAAPPPEQTYPRALLKEAEGRPSIRMDDPRYDALWQRTRETMGMHPIHTDGVHRIEHILRVFDLNPRYVDCAYAAMARAWA